ncbi:hypothetical protein [Cellulosimicrobium sp. Marseille-Q8652]
MVHPAAPGRLERGGGLADDRAGLLRVDDAARDDLGERDPDERLRDDVRRAVLRPDVEDAGEAGIGDERGAPRGVERVGDVRAGDERDAHRPVEDLVVRRPGRDVGEVGRELLVQPIAGDEQCSWGHAVHRTSFGGLVVDTTTWYAGPECPDVQAKDRRRALRDGGPAPALIAARDVGRGRGPVRGAGRARARAGP